MFRRRNPLSWFESLWALVWPRSGWSRAFRYLYYRVLRLPGSTHAVASGFSTGVAMSFTPMVGTHFPISALISWATGGSVIASLFGTFIGNPWTYPLIWVLTYETGNILLGNGIVPIEPSVFLDAFEALVVATFTLDWQRFVDDVWPLWGPMLLGAVPWGIASWLGTYVVLARLTDIYRARVLARRAARRKLLDQAKTVLAARSKRQEAGP